MIRKKSGRQVKKSSVIKKAVKKSPKKSTVKKRVIKKKILPKRPVKKSSKNIAGKKKTQPNRPVKKPKENIVGVVTHYFPQVAAAAIRLKAPLKLGDNIRIKGHTTDFTQVINSLQVNCVSITKAKKGQEIGLLADSRVRRRDVVYKI